MDPTFYESYYRHETTHWWFRWRFDLIGDVMKSLPRNGRKRILEAGSGTGQMLKMLEKHGDAAGIDISPQAIRYARARGVKQLIQGSISALPFKADAFDCVLALDVIEHVDDDIGILTKLFDVVKPGGYLVVTVPAYKILWSEHDEINQHKRRYRAGDLSSLIKDAGFDLHRVTYCNTALFLPVLAMRKAKNLLRTVRRARGTDHDGLDSDLDEYPGPINTALYWLMKGETKLMRHVNLPFGVSILAVARRPLVSETAPIMPVVVPTSDPLVPDLKDLPIPAPVADHVGAIL
jgi:SAM-dependent methyltransferase